MASSADDLFDVVNRLERQLLRNIVLLKHIEAFREHVSVAQVSDGPDAATLVLLDAKGSLYDRETYPQATFAALISSDHPRLTRRLLDSVPAHAPVVFKLAGDGDRDVVAERFPISRATSFLSFTGNERATFVADGQVSVSVSRSASDEVLRLLESQGHPRDWLLPLLASDRAFVCVLEHDAGPLSACIAFENHRQIWEVGGVVTPAPHRGRGFAARVVRTTLAELQRQSAGPFGWPRRSGCGSSCSSRISARGSLLVHEAPVRGPAPFVPQIGHSVPTLDEQSAAISLPP